MAIIAGRALRLSDVAPGDFVRAERGAWFMRASTAGMWWNADGVLHRRVLEFPAPGRGGHNPPETFKPKYIRAKAARPACDYKRAYRLNNMATAIESRMK